MKCNAFILYYYNIRLTNTIINLTKGYKVKLVN
jgi:hypothetical protein